RAVAFRPDGRLVSGGSGRSVRVGDPLAGECRLAVKAAAPVHAVAVAPDGKAVEPLHDLPAPEERAGRVLLVGEPHQLQSGWPSSIASDIRQADRFQVLAL